MTDLARENAFLRAAPMIYVLGDDCRELLPVDWLHVKYALAFRQSQYRRVHTIYDLLMAGF